MRTDKIAYRPYLFTSIVVLSALSACATKTVSGIGGVTVSGEDDSQKTCALRFFEEHVYPGMETQCSSCHTTGIGGAPIFMENTAFETYLRIKASPWVGVLDPDNNPLVLKGKHVGPAPSADLESNLQQWLSAEVSYAKWGSCDSSSSAGSTSSSASGAGGAGGAGGSDQGASSSASGAGGGSQGFACDVCNLTDFDCSAPTGLTGTATITARDANGCSGVISTLTESPPLWIHCDLGQICVEHVDECMSATATPTSFSYVIPDKYTITCVKR
jgi:hypothetical protein